jgi:hypothetical protein
MAEKWLKLNKDHDYWKNPIIGVILAYTPKESIWYSQNGKNWSGGKLKEEDINYWKEFGFEECTIEDVKNHIVIVSQSSFNSFNISSFSSKVVQKCYRCENEMTYTPICCNCGIIPITQASDLEKNKEILLLHEENARLKKENANLIKLITENNIMQEYIVKVDDDKTKWY